MAGQEHLDILKKGVERWNVWRQENSGVNPDLSYANLASASLRQADLKRTNLARADLRKANLMGADLTRADLRGADLREANLTMATLRGADLFDVNLEGAILKNINLSGIKIHYDALQFLPDHEKKQYGSSFTLYNLTEEFFEPKPESGSCGLEIPSEYLDIGINILNQFLAILNQRRLDSPKDVRIEQNGLNIRMTINPDENDEEIIQAALDDNSIVPLEELSLEDCLKDKDLILELRTEIKEVISNSRDQKQLMQKVYSQLEKTVEALRQH